MANDISSLVQVGRLTRDPELKSTNGGTYFCRFTLASTSGYGDKENTGFFDCIAWGKLAEVIAKYVQKGARIGVSGSLRHSSWQNTEGKTLSRVEIYVDNFQFLDSKRGEATQSEELSLVGASVGDDSIPF